MKNLSRWNRFLKIVFCLYAIYAIFHEIEIGAYDRIASTAAVFLAVSIPWLFRNVFHYQLSDLLESVYLIFIFLGHILGSVVNLYSSIWWWDLFVHGMSGVLTSILGLFMLKQFKLLDHKNKWFIILFMLVFSLAVASCWEFFEFTVDKITGGDTQWVKTTGVTDTMTDMLIAFFGSILFSVCYFILSKKKKDILKKLENTL